MNNNGKGVFSLDIFEGVESSMSIADTPINEEGEFAPKSYAKTGADNGVKDGSVSIPGGIGERPTAKPEGGEYGPSAPSGDGSGKGQNYGPSIPQGTELTTDEWKNAMNALQRSFKEGVELMQMLENCKIVEETTEEKQEALTEMYVEEAIFEAAADGPYYEAAGNSNKKEIKAIAKKIRKRLVNIKRQQGYRKGETSYGSGVPGKILFPIMFNRNNKELHARAWQIVCYIVPEKRLAMKYVIEDLNSEFKEDLGEYKLRIIKMVAKMKTQGSELSDYDLKRTGFSVANMYILLVDDGSGSGNTINVELDANDVKKLRNATGKGKKAYKEFVEFIESCNKCCDECDEEDKKCKEEEKKSKKKKSKKSDEDDDDE